MVIKMNGVGVAEEQRTVAVARSHMMLVIGRWSEHPDVDGFPYSYAPARAQSVSKRYGVRRRITWYSACLVETLPPR